MFAVPPLSLTVLGIIGEFKSQEILLQDPIPTVALARRSLSGPTQLHMNRI